MYFVKRADNATSSDFSVSDFETYIKDAHEAAISASDDTCGGCVGCTRGMGTRGGLVG